MHRRCFCYLEEDAPIRLDDDSVKFGACRVCCIRRGKPPVILVETLRRPEQSPLDVPNTALSGLVVIDDVLWVLGNAEPAYYSRGIKAVGFPMGEPDGLKEVTDKQQVAGMFNTMKQGHKRFDKFLIGEGYSVQSSIKPNCLPVSGPSGENLVLWISLFQKIRAAVINFKKGKTTAQVVALLKSI